VYGTADKNIPAASHVVMISHRREVAELIERAIAEQK
jgi:hypothetical protein